MGAAATVSRADDNTRTYSTGKKENMLCETCSTSVSVFTRKKCCDCSKMHCGKCLTQIVTVPKGTRKVCSKCKLLASGCFTRQELSAYTIKDLRLYLTQRKVDVRSCTEKSDLVELAMQWSQRQGVDREHLRHVEQLKERMRRENSSSQVPAPPTQAQPTDSQTPPSNSPAPPSISQAPPSYSEITPTDGTPRRPTDASMSHTFLQGSSSFTSSVSTTNMEMTGDVPQAESTTPEPMELEPEDLEDIPTAVATPGAVAVGMKTRATLALIQTESDVEGLTVRQLKEILVTNYVDYKGCCEKQELVDRVTRLWNEESKNKEIGVKSGGVNESELCKICMDAVIDCILLECGHMITCTQCGKRMAECPVCRHYVSRVVHVFRA